MFETTGSNNDVEDRFVHERLRAALSNKFAMVCLLSCLSLLFRALFTSEFGRRTSSLYPFIKCKATVGNRRQVLRHILMATFLRPGLTIGGPSMGGLEAFVIDSNEALRFRLLKTPQDLDASDSEDDFEPAMTHQIYGDKYV